MSRTKEMYIDMLNADEIEFDDSDYFLLQWNGESEDMTMHQYLKHSGDTFQEICGQQPDLLEFEF